VATGFNAIDATPRLYRCGNRLASLKPDGMVQPFTPAMTANG
jgi:hypothetical protein